MNSMRDGCQVTARGIRVGLLATHPVQYYVPWYRALARAVDLRVFYCQRPTPEQQAAAGFGVPFEWERPLLDGYDHLFSREPRSPSGSRLLLGLRYPGDRGPDPRRTPRRLHRPRLGNQGDWQAMWACWRERIPLIVQGDSQLPTARPWLWRRVSTWSTGRSFPGSTRISSSGSGRVSTISGTGPILGACSSAPGRRQRILRRGRRQGAPRAGPVAGGLGHSGRCDRVPVRRQVRCEEATP